MYGNAYQNGPYFEVWDSKVNADKNPLYQQLFKTSSSNMKKYFDKEVKNYLYGIFGQTSKIILPADDHKELALHQKYLVLHLYVPLGQNWSMEIGITDINNFKRRINLTTVQGKQEVKYFSLRYPLDHLEKGCWLYLAINVYSFMEAFKQTVFRSLDHITVCSNCKLRRIFTMKEWNHWEIPKNYWFSNEIPQEFQLIEFKDQFLPKIVNKNHLHYSQPVNSLYEKLTPKKMESKIALAKSQLSPVPGQMAKSKIYNQKNSEIKSPNRAVSLEPITRRAVKHESKFKQEPPKLRLNSMKDEAMLNHLHNDMKNSNKEKIILKSSNKKKIIVEKSFQEDEALLPQGQSDLDFETSSQVQQEKVEKKQIEKWSEQENQVNVEEKKQNKVRTIISKENIETVVKVEKREGKIGDEVELIFDEMVGCYYHPETNTYFQIKN